MATGSLMPQIQFQALDDAGVAVAGALVNFYASGTSTRVPAYADAGLTTPLSNPAACDAGGRLVAYLSPVAYKVVVTTSAGVPIGATIDPFVASAGATGQVGAALGEVFVFGSNSSASITDLAYPAGATFDKLVPGTGVLNLDSATLAPGTYVLEITGQMAAAGTLTVALVNLDDGAPDTPLVTATLTSLTGERARSGTITFAPSGAAKNYGLKARVTANDGFLISARILRTA